MGSRALISVVIPVHDGSRYLGETLAAVARQSHRALEIVVVDDGSSDNSMSIVERDAPHARRLATSNAGTSSARNAGFAVARGAFIAFLDQDDVWHEEHLERQLAAFDRCPRAGVVVSPYRHWYPDPDGRYAEAAPLLAAAVRDGLDDDFTGWVYHQFLLDCWALTSATLLRREALEAVGGFDPKRAYGEDWDLWLRLSRVVPFAKLNGPPVLYRQHSAQGSRRARAIDHRTELLLANAAAHGLASRDGRALSARAFARTIARYQMEFGYHHLCKGDARTGTLALWKAWRRDPLRLRYLALALAACGGWRPRLTAADASGRIAPR